MTPKHVINTAKHPFFSVIIPVYNAEEYISRCLGSVLTQNVDLEIILVDDGSEDNSLSIIKKNKNQNIKYVEHKSNRGQGAARNTGLRQANGEYILFMDCDDWYEKGALSGLKSQIEASSYPDVIIFSFNIKNENNTKSGFHKFIEKSKGVYSGEELISMFIERKINPAPWNKAFKRNFWNRNNFKFAEDMSHDDFALIPFVISQAELGVILANRYYNYLVHCGGITGTVSDKKIKSSIESVEELRRNFSVGDKLNFITEMNFQAIAIAHFRSGFNARKQICSDEQIKYWVSLMSEFIVKYQVPGEYFLKNTFALKFLAEVNCEIDKRGVDADILHAYEGEVKSFILHNLSLLTCDTKKKRFRSIKKFKNIIKNFF